MAFGFLLEVGMFSVSSSCQKKHHRLLACFDDIVSLFFYLVCLVFFFENLYLFGLFFPSRKPLQKHGHGKKNKSKNAQNTPFALFESVQLCPQRVFQHLSFGRA